MKPGRYALSLLLVAAIVAFYQVVRVNSTTVALSLLLAILFISARFGLPEATVASFTAMLGFNYFFLPPVGTLTIEDPQNWVALIAFLVTAATASQLSDRARRRAAEAEDRRRDVERLYSLIKSVMLSAQPRHTARELAGHVVQIFGCNEVALFSLADDEIFRFGSETSPITEHDLKVALELDGPSEDAVRGLMLCPVRLGARPLGALALAGSPPPKPVVSAIADLAAISIERARALSEASHAEAVRQSEELKAALMDALAHDIKTPLTSIKAAATALLAAGGRDGEHELLTIIDEETDRLNQIAAEVIAMARIEAGKLHLERREVAVDEIVTAALGEIPAAARRRIRIDVPRGLPAANADPEFIQQVLKQLADNALKYSPAGAMVTITAALENEKIVIAVADRGPGIDENERARIFEKFFRGRRHRFEVKGTGMGLPIAKGIIDAHREHIWVESEPGQGSIFRFSLAPAAGSVSE